MSRSSSSGLFSKYKGKYKTYLAERRANSKSKASQDLDSVAEAAIASNGNPFGNGRQTSKEAAAAAQAADNAALDKDMDAFFEEVSQIKVILPFHPSAHVDSLHSTRSEGLHVRLPELV